MFYLPVPHYASHFVTEIGAAGACWYLQVQIATQPTAVDLENQATLFDITKVTHPVHAFGIRCFARQVDVRDYCAVYCALDTALLTEQVRCRINVPSACRQLVHGHAVLRIGLSFVNDPPGFVQAVVMAAIHIACPVLNVLGWRSAFNRDCLIHTGTVFLASAQPQPGKDGGARPGSV